MEKSRAYASRTLIIAWLCVAAFACAVGVIRYWFPERPADYVGPRAFLDAGFALGLLALVLIIAGGLGRIFLRALKVQSLTISELGLFSLVSGLGIVAYGVLALGLVGILHWWSVAAWLAVCAVVGARGWGKWIARLPELVSKGVNWCRQLQLWQKALLCIALLILVLSIVQALAPPWSLPHNCDSGSTAFHSPPCFVRESVCLGLGLCHPVAGLRGAQAVQTPLLPMLVCSRFRRRDLSSYSITPALHTIASEVTTAPI